MGQWDEIQIKADQSSIKGYVESGKPGKWRRPQNLLLTGGKEARRGMNRVR